MKRILFLLIISIGLFMQPLASQTTKANGISYQAIARDATGKILANAPVALKISFSVKNNGNQNFYTEVQQVLTDETGLINLVIGNGKETVGAFQDIPWDTEQVWLDIEMDAKGGRDFALMGSTELYAVPYAFHAATASELIQDSAIDLPTEKAQSIYWLTGGNDQTRPATHFAGTQDAQDFVFKTNNVTRVILTKDGQMQVKSGVTGADDDKANYPITIEGSTQGIYIHVTGKRSSANDFMTFADDENTWGQVEGQTLDELYDSWEYKSQIALFTLSAIQLAASAIAFGIEAAGLYAAAVAAGATIILAFASPGFALAAGSATAHAIVLAAEVISLGIEIDNWKTETVNGVGVTYNSGAGDYAEWLQRTPGTKDLHYGEVVGINGGLVSLNTQSAQHYMVVSKQPIVLGNAPQEKFKKNFEKIAFMGQVPVKVAGKVNAGDYIIPSGNNDGFGIAVNPKAMKIGDFARIVGVAWASAPDKPLNYVNVGVGLNSNELAPKVDEIATKVDNIMAFLEGKGSLRPENAATAGTSQAQAGETILAKQMNDQEYDQFVDQHADYFTELFSNVKLELVKKGVNLNKHPEISSFLDNPIPMMKQVRRDPGYLTQWGSVDAKLIQNKRK